ncbi:hypothetical protein ACOME3_005235 [Neoechinorhynchus agilis]
MELDIYEDDDGIAFERLPHKHNKFIEKMALYFNGYKEKVKKSPIKRHLKNAFKWLLAVAYLVYFGFAMSESFGHSQGKDLFIMTIIILIILILKLDILNKLFRRVKPKFDKSKNKKRFNFVVRWTRVAASVGILMALIFFMARERSHNWYQGFLGIIVMLGIVFVSSKTPFMVNWKIVTSSLVFEVAISLVILKTSTGQFIIKYLSDKVKLFLSSTDHGMAAVYGSLYKFPVNFTLVNSSYLLPDNAGWNSMAIEVRFYDEKLLDKITGFFR